eukprot:PhM_4_TR5698/c0_g1_i2/m.18265
MATEGANVDDCIDNHKIEIGDDEQEVVQHSNENAEKEIAPVLQMVTERRVPLPELSVSAIAQPLSDEDYESACTELEVMPPVRPTTAALLPLTAGGGASVLMFARVVLFSEEDGTLLQEAILSCTRRRVLLNTEKGVMITTLRPDEISAVNVFTRDEDGCTVVRLFRTQHIEDMLQQQQQQQQLPSWIQFVFVSKPIANGAELERRACSPEAFVRLIDLMSRAHCRSTTAISTTNSPLPTSALPVLRWRNGPNSKHNNPTCMSAAKAIAPPATGHITSHKLNELSELRTKLLAASTDLESLRLQHSKRVAELNDLHRQASRRRDMLAATAIDEGSTCCSSSHAHIWSLCTKVREENEMLRKESSRLQGVVDGLPRVRHNVLARLEHRRDVMKMELEVYAYQKRFLHDAPRALAMLVLQICDAHHDAVHIRKNELKTAELNRIDQSNSNAQHNVNVAAAKVARKNKKKANSMRNDVS